MTTLRQKMIEEMTLREFSPRTQEAYLRAVTELAKYYNQSPDKITKGMIRDYLLYLIQDRKLAWSSRNIVISGLKFFYTHTIGKKSLSLSIPPRKQTSKLPEILSGEELESLFGALSNQKHRTLLMTAYSAGLRLSEVVGLKVTDIDSKRMMIRVEQGKGRKDRYTILSKRLLTELRIYWKMYKPPVWLFCGANVKRPLTGRSAQSIYYKAKNMAGIKKGKGIHTLRHCFATHLLEAGVNVRTIQALMGHTSIMTTMIYLQVTRKQISSTQSPLDLLEIPESNDFFKK
ncbi:MAG TPA: integrase [Nitrospirae bacterium]|nr:tyrosine recombinase XerD [bacterium BMS3Abin06]HDH12998.1 integrase [Nitrospirota bacterium]HDZ01723.1 integrase [Nitrospirota bacterium]